MHPLFKDIFSIIADALFPLICLGCQTDGTIVCENCLRSLEPITQNICAICRLPSSNGATHIVCASPATPDGLISLFDYKNPLMSKIIITGKYKFIPEIFKTLGKLIGQDRSTQKFLEYPNSIISFIPLHRSRLRWRGFNQSELLGQPVAVRHGIPIVPLLARTRPGKVQKDLNKVEREHNLHDIFAPLSLTDIKNKNILLVDDVVTTGATLLSATRELKQGGAARVWCLTLTRD